jgi:hypothetical protein
MHLNNNNKLQFYFILLSGDYVTTRPALVRGDPAVLGGLAGGQRVLQLPDEPADRRRKRHMGSQCDQTSCKVICAFGFVVFNCDNIQKYGQTSCHSFVLLCLIIIAF